jgi:hypothetical protein
MVTVEDLAGVAIVLTILASAIIAAYESIQRLLHPQPIVYLSAVVVASIIGFPGNEGVAIFRIRVGKEIGSAALIGRWLPRACRWLEPAWLCCSARSGCGWAIRSLTRSWVFS